MPPSIQTHAVENLGGRHESLEARYLRIAQTLDPLDLSVDDDDPSVDLNEQVERQLLDKHDGRLLGFYTRRGMLRALEAYGFLDELRHRGYAEFDVEFRLDEYAHRMRLLADGLLVCECRLRRTAGATDPCLAEVQSRHPVELFYVEWVQLEDPRAEFTAERPRLPGQRYPGSGLGQEVFTLFGIAARRLRLDGILEVPAYFHNAVLYARAARFIDPFVEGRFLALTSLLAHHPLHEVSWAITEARVVDDRGEPIGWTPREQLVAFSPALVDYFEMPEWRRARNAARLAFHPRLLPRERSE